MVFIVGTMPPPLGGVSVYCFRRVKFLNARKVKNRFIPARSPLGIFKFLILVYLELLKNKSVCVELNSGNIYLMFFLWIFGVSKFTDFYDHNSSRQFSGKFSPRSIVFRSFISSCANVFICNESLIENYNFLRAKDKINVFLPYIRPTDDEISRSRESFLQHGFGKLVAEGRRNIILCSAWKPISTIGEPDLYGILDTLEIYRKLLIERKDIICCFLLGSYDDSNFSKQVLSSVSELNKFDNFVFISGGLSQLALLPRTRILIRLTKTDGDSVSVREAIDLGVEVLASDTVTRPKEVHLCDLSNKSLVYDKVKELLGDVKE